MGQQDESERVPLTTDTDADVDDFTTAETSDLHQQLEEDPRFNPPPPSWPKRLALLLVIGALFWLAMRLRPNSGEKKVVYAQRYSREHKFRPAASPIVTETLVDGRVKVRGAAPTSSSTPTPTAQTFEEKKARALRRAKGKKKKGTRKAARS